MTHALSTISKIFHNLNVHLYVCRSVKEQNDSDTYQHHTQYQETDPNDDRKWQQDGVQTERNISRRNTNIVTQGVQKLILEENPVGETDEHGWN